MRRADSVIGSGSLLPDSPLGTCVAPDGPSRANTSDAFVFRGVCPAFHTRRSALPGPYTSVSPTLNLELKSSFTRYCSTVMTVMPEE
jgi:hypothetical protein